MNAFADPIRPPCFEPRALVLAQHRALFRWYCDKKLGDRGKTAVCVSDREGLQRMRGFDPDGWELHIAGEPPLGWLADMFEAMVNSGFGRAKLASMARR